MTVTIYNALMTHSVQLIKIVQDFSGSWSTASGFPVTESGFVEYGQKRVTNTDGEEVTSTAVVFLKNDSVFDPNHDRWQFVDVKNSRTFNIAGWEVIDDPRTGQTHHYEITVI